MNKWLKFVPLLVLLLALPAGYWFYTDSANQPRIKQQQVFTNLEFTLPTGIYFPDDGSDLVYVTELSGRVLRFANDVNVTSSEVVLDIRSKMGSIADEEGLVSLAFDPDFSRNGYFYLHYTMHDPLQTIVSRFILNSSGMAPIDSERVLIQLDQPYRNHNGGALMFDKQGMLMIGLGDGGLFYDPHGNGQNTTNWFSSILRINPDRVTDKTNYTIPEDNPFVDDPAVLDEIYAYGVRNPYKMSQDLATSDIWFGDVGQDDREEVNILQQGGNYGWSTYEGTLCLPEQDCNLDYVKPYFEYSHEHGTAIIGGFVYRGNTIENLEGKYLLADWFKGEIYWIPTSVDKVERHLILEINYLVSSFGQDLNNELYTCAFDGRIFKLVQG